MNDSLKWLVFGLLIVLMSSCGLHRAVQTNDIEKVKGMIAEGADVNKPQKGWTPLMYSAFYGYPDMTQTLIDKGAEVNAQFNSGKPNLKKGDDQMVYDPKTLKSSYAKFNGFTALHFAVYYDFLDTIKVLLENGADKNIEDAYGQKPIDYARRFHMTYLVSVLED